jgi:hypothetical protein
MAESSTKYFDVKLFEEDLNSLSADLQELVDLNVRIEELERLMPMNGNLSLKVDQLSKRYTEHKATFKAVDSQMSLMLIRYSASPDHLALLTRVDKSLKILKDSVNNMLKGCTEACIEQSITDMMDESFSKLIEIHEHNTELFTRDLFLNNLMRFVQVPAEPQIRESVQLLQVCTNSTIVERYKTVILKLKRHNTLYTHLKDRFEKYLSHFRFALEMEGAKSIPIRLLNNADGGSMVNYSIIAGGQNQFFDDNKAAVSTSAQFIISKHNTSEFQPLQREKDDSNENDFFPLNLNLLKSYASENEIGSFMRVANLLMYQIQMKTNTAIELYSLEEVLSKGLAEFLKLFLIPQVKKLLDEQQSVKELIIQRTISLIYSVGNAIQGKLSNDNEISMYNIISRLFIIERRLAEVFTDRTDLRRFYNISIDSIFAFTLKRFVRVIRDKSKYFFENYLKDHLGNFKKLDLFNKDLNTALALEIERELGDDKFYKKYNESAKKSKFFSENTVKQHYMVPFHFILQQISKNTKGASIWAIKAAVYELLICLMKKRKFINFYGYFSLMLNLDAFLLEVIKEFSQSFSPIIGALGELRFLKHFFFKLIYNETQQNSPKKTSSVYVHSKKIKISYDLGGSEEAFTFEQLAVTKTDKLELPASFNLEIFHDELAFNEIVS